MFAGARGLITVARHRNVLPLLRRALGLDVAAIPVTWFERMRAGDPGIIRETVGHWLSDWPNRFFAVAGSAGLPSHRLARRPCGPGPAPA